MKTKRLLSALPCLLLCAACSDDATSGFGQLSVVVEAEDTIIEGLEAGSEGESIQDGWNVSFERYVAVLGDIEVALATDPTVAVEEHTAYAIDLTKIPAEGLPLWQLDRLESGEWQFNYSVVGAGDEASAHATVSADVFDEMAAADASYLVEGTMSRADGLSCPPSALASPPADATPESTNAAGDDCYAAPSVSFRFLASAETSFGPCEIDGVPGFSVASGSTTTVATTIHGDHIFFNGFPEGDEGGIMRLAQWLADCDLNLDGEVTQAELEQIAPADLPELDERFQLGGSPITPLDDMWDYVRAQLKTQGHFQGEGECPIDGKLHDHS